MKNKREEFCTGCGLCHCAYDLQFYEDKKHFLYPKIDYNKFSQKEMDYICPFGNEGVSKYDKNVWGAYQNVYRGFATDDDVRFRASSGGIITAISTYLIKNKMVDGVILTKADEKVPYHCQTFCARTEQEILNACGSRYSQSSPLMDILSLMKDNERYCVVGKPCDISALRRYAEKNEKIKNKIVCMLSFFCAGMPSDDANRKLLSELGSKECKELRYRGYGWPGLTTAIDNDGNIYTMEYENSWMKILGRDIRKCCKFCFDGIGENADISCGDVWNLGANNQPEFGDTAGYNVVFARTEIGKNILEWALKDGYISLENWDENINSLRYCQPNHFMKRTTVLAKVAALRLMRKPAPSFNIRNMCQYARQIGLKTQLSVFKGTVKRIIKNKL